jgi:hypothetical protein
MTRLEAEAAKRLAVKTIIDVLDSIRNGSRQPDLWERTHLVNAVSAAYRGAYKLAAFEAVIAQALPSERSPAAILPDEPVYHTADLDRIRSALAEVEAEPVKLWPEFGPIVFEMPNED